MTSEDNMKKIMFFSILMLFLLTCTTAASASCIIPEDCDRLWNVKWFTCDYGHENDFVLQRDGTPVCGSENCPNFPCWGSVYTQSSYSAGEINWNIMDNGRLNLWHCKDNQVYGDTYLFVISTKTIHVPRESDVGRVWLNDVDITDDGGDMNLQAGWNHLEWTSYSQNQDTAFKFNYDFASNVLLMNSEPLPPDIIVEDADVIWNPMINETPAELDKSINAIEPRIILEYVDSINSTWNATVESVPDALNDSVNAIEPRIILEYVDSINSTWNATVKSVPDALNDSVNAIEPRIILEYVDSINSTWNPILIQIPFEIDTTSPIVSISTDKYEYTTGETMNINITLANPAEEWKHVYFAWRLDLPDYELQYWIMINELYLPPDYEQTLTIPVTVGDYGIPFNAFWYVALYNTTTLEVISEDIADWRYVPAKERARDGDELMPEVEEIAREISKTVEKIKFPT
ncbi:MAG TPA: hypothetical protein C5S37_03690 [Methanophagales archaeon]|nr:hypothetical protein [Methanophagales archaeon]